MEDLKRGQFEDLKMIGFENLIGKRCFQFSN